MTRAFRVLWVVSADSAGSLVTLYGATYFLSLLWSPYVIGQTIIFSCCGLFDHIYFHAVVCSFFFFFPRLISAAADWMSAILPHMVWP